MKKARRAVKPERDIGGLWKRATSSGEAYLSGTIEIDGVKHRIVAFRNAYKSEGDRTPDFRIYFQRKREEEPREAGGNEGPPSAPPATPDIVIDQGELPPS